MAAPRPEPDVHQRAGLRRGERAALLVGGELEADGEEAERGRERRRSGRAQPPRASAGTSGRQPSVTKSAGTSCTPTSSVSQRGTGARSYMSG